jgi:hypothetical protein
MAIEAIGAAFAASARSARHCKVPPRKT